MQLKNMSISQHLKKMRQCYVDGIVLACNTVKLERKEKTMTRQELAREFDEIVDAMEIVESDHPDYLRLEDLLSEVERSIALLDWQPIA